MKIVMNAGIENDVMNVDLRLFIDRVVVPALLNRFLREQAAGPNVEAEKPEFQKIEGRA